MKVMTIVGARPQFIKAAVVSRAFKEYRPDVHEVLVHTGQHYDVNMSDVFFDELGIPRPDYNLGVGGGTHGQNTGRMIERLEALMIKCSPDCVIVYGDTDSTLAGAVAAAKLQLPVAHVEAGLRSFNRRMPEEINRVLTDHLSDVLFAPTSLAVNNLYKEGINEEKCYCVGDVMYDATLYYKDLYREPDWFSGMGLGGASFLLCTVHRAENTDDEGRLRGIFDGLARCKQRIIIPLHPRTKKKLEELNIKIADNIFIGDPVGFLEMGWLESKCEMVITDSGGVQKEAYFHRKPCVTLRDETEWLELVDSGWNFLVGANPDSIAERVASSFLPGKINDLYGEGNASKKIVEILLCASK